MTIAKVNIVRPRDLLRLILTCSGYFLGLLSLTLVWIFALGAETTTAVFRYVGF